MKVSMFKKMLAMGLLIQMMALPYAKAQDGDVIVVEEVTQIRIDGDSEESREEIPAPEATAPEATAPEATAPEETQSAAEVVEAAEAPASEEQIEEEVSLEIPSVDLRLRNGEALISSEETATEEQEEEVSLEVPNVDLRLRNGEALISSEERTGEVQESQATEPQTHCMRRRPVTNSDVASDESDKDNKEENEQVDASFTLIMAQIAQLNESVRSMQQMTNMLMMFSMFNQNSIQFFPTAAQNANPLGSLSTIIYGQMMAGLMSNQLPSANIAGAQAAQPTYQIMGDLNFLGNGLGQNNMMAAPQAFNQIPQVNSQAPFSFNFDGGTSMTSPLAIL